MRGRGDLMWTFPTVLRYPFLAGHDGRVHYVIGVRVQSSRFAGICPSPLLLPFLCLNMAKGSMDSVGDEMCMEYLPRDRHEIKLIATTLKTNIVCLTWEDDIVNLQPRRWRERMMDSRRRCWNPAAIDKALRSPSGIAGSWKPTPAKITGGPGPLFNVAPKHKTLLSI